ncbi:MAG TPA: RiPP maturation radical SAM C-methyltransferase [Pyrinomonadaceae bacterium]|nr:RiPP maturation radical SAM C-methyltransferase [Pyrinomonadaceae bacterium]
MFRICLVNMPFAALHAPSIALTQLKSVLDKEYGDRVEVEVLYLNQEFGRYFGKESYDFIATAPECHNSGLGDWFFRQSAFPEMEDNTELYFRRYFPVASEHTKSFRRAVEEKRAGLNEYLDRLIDEHRLSEADVVGMTSMFAQNLACFALAKRLKERNKAVVTVMGGANCESPMGLEIVRNVKQIDYVFSGPALKSFPQFVERLLSSQPERIGSIKGVLSKSNCLPINGQSAIGEELDINADVHLDYGPFIRTVKENFPNKEVEPILMFETSRGCWWGQKAHCTFCGLNGASMTYRAMEAERAVAQFDSLFKYSDDCSRFECVDNIMPTNYPAEVFPRIKTPARASIFYEVKADLTIDELQALAKARVRYIQPGIEALSTSTLKLMKKGTSAFQNVSFLKNCLSCEIFPVWNLLVGFPGEDEEVYKKYLADIPLLYHLVPPSGVFPVRYDRFSPYFVQAEQYGLDLHPFDFYTLTYPFSQESLANLAYYFVDRNVRAKYMTDLVRWISQLQEKVSVWHARWYGREASAPAPKLFFKDGPDSNIVCDSRSGQLIEHKLTEAAREVLGVLNKPKRMSQVAAELKHLPGLDAEGEIHHLGELGLLFHESDRFISLVLGEEPPTMSARA